MSEKGSGMQSVIKSIFKNHKGNIYHWRFIARGNYDELERKQAEAKEYLDQQPRTQADVLREAMRSIGIKSKFRPKLIAVNTDYQGRTKSDFEIMCEKEDQERRSCAGMQFNDGLPLPEKRRAGRPRGAKNKPK
jgi:hypothetical protein